MLLSLCMRTVDDGWLWLWANVFVWVFISKSIYLQHGRQSSSSVQQFSRSTKRPLSLSFWQVVFDQLFGVLCSSHSVKQVIDAVHFTASHWMPPGDLTVQWGTGNYHPFSLSRHLVIWPFSLVRDKYVSSLAHLLKNSCRYDDLH